MNPNGEQVAPEAGTGGGGLPLPASGDVRASDRPILFSTPMVKAILDGKKTQTRRLVRMPFLGPSDGVKRRVYGPDDFAREPETIARLCPSGRSGRRLWVREAWARRLDEDRIKPRHLKPGYAWYWADPQTCNTGCAGAAGKKRPGIHMPRWASRITLEVTDVRVQRPQDISEADARAEGIIEWIGDNGAKHYGLTVADVWETTARAAFRRLWNDINGERADWESSPWVWALTFRRVTP